MNALFSSIFCAVFELLGLLPVRVRRLIGRCGGTLFYLIPIQEREIAALHLKKILHLENPYPTVRRMYQSLGIAFLESMNFEPFLNPNNGWIKFPNRETFRRLRDQGKGIVALTAHTGNWELLGSFVVQQGVTLTTAGKEAKIGLLQSLLERVRNRAGMKTVWRSDSRAVRTMMEDLKNGGLVAALIDQDTSVASTYIPFFGMEARTPTGLVDIGKRTGSAFGTIFMARDTDGTYTVYFEEIDQTLPTEEIVRIYHSRLETLLRKYPEQWVWFHKRWRSIPGTDTMRTKQYIEYLSGLPQ